MKRVLAAIDGSDTAQGALRWATDLATTSSAELVIATVIEENITKMAVSGADDVRGAVKRRLSEEWCADLLARQVPHRLLTLEGHVGRSLLACAEGERADLIVAGREGHGPWSLVGSVTSYLAHHTNIPLLIVPPELGEPGPKATVIVGVDGSAASRVAFEWAIATAKVMSMRVAVIHVVNTPVEWVPRTDEKSWAARAAHELEELAGAASDQGVEIITRTPADVHPVEGLNQAVDNFGASLVVVGARGVGGFTGLRLGGVALQLMHHMKVATVVVPSAADR